MDDFNLLENLAAIEALEIIEEDATEYPEQVNCTNKNPFEGKFLQYIYIYI